MAVKLITIHGIGHVDPDAPLYEIDESEDGLSFKPAPEYGTGIVARFRKIAALALELGAAMGVSS